MTTSAKEYIQAEASKKLDEAAAIAEGAKSAARSLTEDDADQNPAFGQLKSHTPSTAFRLTHE